MLTVWSIHTRHALSATPRCRFGNRVRDCALCGFYSLVCGACKVLSLASQEFHPLVIKPFPVRTFTQLFVDILVVAIPLPFGIISPLRRMDSTPQVIRAIQICRFPLLAIAKHCLVDR